MKKRAVFGLSAVVVLGAVGCTKTQYTMDGAGGAGASGGSSTGGAGASGGSSTGGAGASSGSGSSTGSSGGASTGGGSGTAAGTSVPAAEAYGAKVAEMLGSLVSAARGAATHPSQDGLHDAPAAPTDATGGVDLQNVTPAGDTDPAGTLDHDVDGDGTAEHVSFVDDDETHARFFQWTGAVGSGSSADTCDVVAWAASLGDLALLACAAEGNFYCLVPPGGVEASCIPCTDAWVCGCTGPGCPGAGSGSGADAGTLAGAPDGGTDATMDCQQAVTLACFAASKCGTSLVTCGGTLVTRCPGIGDDLAQCVRDVINLPMEQLCDGHLADRPHCGALRGL